AGVVVRVRQLRTGVGSTMARTPKAVRATITSKRTAAATPDRSIDTAVLGKTPGIAIDQVWAPLWFYSALGWLRKVFYDRNNVRQQFGDWIVGSDVDPYQSLGSTRLFLIARVGAGFWLSVAADTRSLAST